MVNGERHQMVLAKFHTSGEQEWECPKCGRLLLFRWSSSYEPIVLVPGNISADHGEQKQERSRPEPQLKQKSGLSDLWLQAIAGLDMSGLRDFDSGFSAT